MEDRGIRANCQTFIWLLDSCLNSGTFVDVKKIQQVLCDRVFDIYVASGDLDGAVMTFDDMPQRSVFSWNKLINRNFAKLYSRVLCLFLPMINENVNPNEATFAAVKSVIVGWPKLREAKVQPAFMEFAEASGFSISVMPSGKGLVPEHHPHFIVTYWGAVSSSFCGEIVESADTYVFVGPIFNDYSSVGYSLLIKKEKAVIGQPNCVTIGNGPSLGWVFMDEFLSALAKTLKKNSTSLENYFDREQAGSGGSDVAFEYVKQIHAMIILHGFGSSTRVCNPIIDLYAKNGFIDSARKVFDLLCFKDSASWVAMISGLSQNGYEQEAILLFCQMHISGIMPTPYVLLSALNACTIMELFEGILRRFTQDDIVSWTAMVAGNVQHDMFTEALKTFGEMKNRGIQSDNIGFSTAISACAGIKTINQGRQIHVQSYVSGFSDDLSIGNAPINLHARCSRIEEAYFVFEIIDPKDNITWNGLISGFDKADNVDKTPTKNHTSSYLKSDTENVSFVIVTYSELSMADNIFCCSSSDPGVAM
ncbi:hypothetical protein Dsin_021451 [Dipteronia sinensis]|uniref:pyruvate decarboxylase n=1 Tax=Dipteronia sinensis TaxID=43782 RepID=A0AAE0A169_9ROSI|nr:hypothetical protein Dsin_021451 [Dipteronia sinensis]